MTFSSPSFLWALGLLTIPIIIHLFHFRKYKKLHFSDVSLLKEVSTKSQIKNRLQHLLVLFARLGIVAAVIMAFAEPFIPGEQANVSTKSSAVSIYVDNSLSMQNRTDRLDLLSEALQDAYEIAESYPREVEFQLITNELSGSNRRFVDFESFASLLDRVTFSPFHQNMESILKFQQNSQIDAEVESVNLFLLSDFENLKDSGEIPEIDSRTTRIIKYDGIYDQNISVDTVWIEAPSIRKGQELQLHFSVTNHGSNSVVDLPVNLEIDNQTNTSVLIDIKPYESSDSSFTITIGKSPFLNGIVSIQDDPITFDNEYHFSAEVKSALRIIEIYEDAAQISPFLTLFDDEDFEYSRMDAESIRQDSIGTPELLILNQLKDLNSGLSAIVSEICSAGNNVLVVLPEAPSEQFKEVFSSEFEVLINNWDTTSLEANRIAADAPLYEDVFESNPENLNYPYSKGHWNLAGPQLNDLISFPNGRAMLANMSNGNGNMYYITTPLKASITNFQRHALFVPSLLNMALQAGSQHPMAYEIGTRKITVTKSLSEAVRLKSTQLDVDFVPGLSHDGILLNGMLKKAGKYLLTNDTSLLATLSFNLSRKESGFNLRNESEIVTAFMNRGMAVNTLDSDTASLNNQIATADLGTSLWPLFILIGLLFFLLESALLKFLP